MTHLSIVIPVLNEQENIIPLIQRLASTFAPLPYQYEIIFIDDHSIDCTVEKITQQKKYYPISLHTKKGEKGKAQSLIEGFSHAQYEFVCMIDADLQYPPEAIPAMLEKIIHGKDIVVARRKRIDISLRRKIVSASYLFFCDTLLHRLHCDIQSGLKVFRKEILDTISLDPSPWTFDLEFLLKARNAGYTITNHPIIFSERKNGTSKVTPVTAVQIGWTAIKYKFFSCKN